MMRKNTQSKVNLPEQLLYPNGKVPIKSAKLNDLRKCIKFIPHDHIDFYNELLQWPTAGSNDGEAEDVGEND